MRQVNTKYLVYANSKIVKTNVNNFRRKELYPNEVNRVKLRADKAYPDLTLLNNSQLLRIFDSVTTRILKHYNKNSDLFNGVQTLKFSQPEVELLTIDLKNKYLDNYQLKTILDDLEKQIKYSDTQMHTQTDSTFELYKVLTTVINNLSLRVKNTLKSKDTNIKQTQLVAIYTSLKIICTIYKYRNNVYYDFIKHNYSTPDKFGADAPQNIMGIFYNLKDITKLLDTLIRATSCLTYLNNNIYLQTQTNAKPLTLFLPALQSQLDGKTRNHIIEIEINLTADVNMLNYRTNLDYFEYKHDKTPTQPILKSKDLKSNYNTYIASYINLFEQLNRSFEILGYRIVSVSDKLGVLKYILLADANTSKEKLTIKELNKQVLDQTVKTILESFCNFKLKFKYLIPNIEINDKLDILELNSELIITDALLSEMYPQANSDSNITEYYPTETFDTRLKNLKDLRL